MLRTTFCPQVLPCYTKHIIYTKVLLIINIDINNYMSFFQVKVRESGHLLGESSSGLSSIDQLTGEVPDHGSDIVCIHNCLKIIRKLLVKTVFVEKSMCK